MEEAVEIAKLRLFLKLAAQVESSPKRPNYGIEPLPDIDFNIRAGNTLVGYASYYAIKEAIEGKQGINQLIRIDLFDAMKPITEKAAEVDRLFKLFRQQQIIAEDGDAEDMAETKLKLRERLKDLENELNLHLGRDYGINVENKAEYQKWLDSHQPFHWYTEFYGIMSEGGFDVIIGNPPYVELSGIRSSYAPIGYITESTGNLYCLVLERSFKLLNSSKALGMIAPMSLSCTERMANLRSVIESDKKLVWLSHFSGDANPSRLFEGTKLRLDILITQRGQEASIFSSAYLRWFAAERPFLFSKISYSLVTDSVRHLGLIPKLGRGPGQDILVRLLNKRSMQEFLGFGSRTIYVHRVLTMFIKCFDFIPYFWNQIDLLQKYLEAAKVGNEL